MKKLFTISILALTINANAQYTKLLDFDSAANGAYPYGSLISDGTFLYGMTYQGGSHNKGVVFKIKPNGTEYANLFDFDGASNGAYPYGNLISVGNFLYGTTFFGGANGDGTIFKIKPDGTGYAKLIDFNYTNGSNPYGDLFYDGTFLYGMINGGTSNSGNIFKIKPDGTKFSELSTINSKSTNKNEPFYSLTYDGTYLYGMKSGSRTGTRSSDCKTLFKIRLDASGYPDLLDSAINAKATPYGSLISDGTFLYGMTQSGGPNNAGIIFKIKPNGTDYVKLLDFIGTNGNNPQGSLLLNGGCLYGMTYGGGEHNMGTIFKFQLDGAGITNSTKMGK
ncbi:MAG: choice-of-anchor tandem repeat GloVer-containing protein [Bacteroidia bacterium]